jgi:hypothetical protein
VLFGKIRQRAAVNESYLGACSGHSDQQKFGRDCEKVSLLKDFGLMEWLNLPNFFGFGILVRFGLALFLDFVRLFLIVFLIPLIAYRFAGFFTTYQAKRHH